MRRDGFDPTADRKTAGMCVAESALGVDICPVTRHDDVKAVLSDHERFSNTRPAGFVGVPGCSPMNQKNAMPANAAARGADRPRS